MLNAILLFGGSSEERLVSVASAQNLAQRCDFYKHVFLDRAGKIYDVSRAELLATERPFEIPFLPRSPASFPSLADAMGALRGMPIFIALHGTEGEDGVLQEMLESRKIPFTGSGAAASRVCFDKDLTKRALRGTSVRLAPQILFHASERQKILSQLESFVREHGKIVIKPVASGSSVGLQIVDNVSELTAKMSELSKLSYDAYLAEKFIRGRELTVGVYEGRDGKVSALPPSEVVLSSGHSFDYQGKYLGKGTIEITPAELSDEDRTQAQKLAIEAHQILKCRGYSRTDMILSDDGVVYLETNTLPGLSKASFIPQQLAVEGIAIPDFVLGQLEIAEKRFS